VCRLPSANELGRRFMKDFHDTLLFTPGPVNVAPRVLAAGSRPMIHHRTDEFHVILESVIGRMKILFGTTEDVLLVHSSGRGAMEGVLRNLFNPGETILSVCNGRFGQMFAEIGEACGLTVHRVFENWLEPVHLDQIDEILGSNPEIRGVTVVHSDTSTARINPLNEIGQIVRRHDRLLVVDCISSLGAMPIRMDEWCVDAAVTASQKGLMAPAGIAFAAVNSRAWQAAQSVLKPGLAFNFKNIRKFYDEKRETPGSTPVSLVASVKESLDMVFEEGIDNVFRRHARLARSIRSALSAIGLAVYPENDAERSPSVTLIRLPASIKPRNIKDMARDRYGVLIASGLGDFQDSTIRIGHLGLMTVREALLIVSVLELVLMEIGLNDSPGKGLATFHRTWQATEL
jgi:aspartate aminotransferase-like enzyme